MQLTRQLAGQVLLALLCVAAQLGVHADEPGVVKGRLVAPGSVNLAAATVLLQTSTGRTVKTSCDSDGTFAFFDVPPGSHLLHPQHMRVIFPEVRLDVSKNQVLLHASYSAQRTKMLPVSPLIVQAAMEAQFYEKRKPVDVWSFVKSPYGIMIVVSVFAIFVFPKMKVDPEEYKEMQAAMKGSPAAGAVGGAAAPAAITGGGGRRS